MFRDIPLGSTSTTVDAAFPGTILMDAGDFPCTTEMVCTDNTAESEYNNPFRNDDIEFQGLLFGVDEVSLDIPSTASDVILFIQISQKMGKELRYMLPDMNWI